MTVSFLWRVLYFNQSELIEALLVHLHWQWGIVQCDLPGSQFSGCSVLAQYFVTKKDPRYIKNF